MSRSFSIKIIIISSYIKKASSKKTQKVDFRISKTSPEYKLSKNGTESTNNINNMKNLSDTMSQKGQFLKFNLVI